MFKDMKLGRGILESVNKMKVEIILKLDEVLLELVVVVFKGGIIIVGKAIKLYYILFRRFKF